MSPSTPRFRHLAGENLLTAPTLAVLQAREERTTGEPRHFAPEAFATFVALIARLKPLVERPTAREIALRIDARLAERKGDGWRYDAMPPDGEAMVAGLAALEAEARADGSPAFAEMNDPDSLIRKVQKGETRLQWGLPPKRFLEDLLAEVVSHAYAQPEAQDSIGYDGYADAQGWSHLEIGDAREPWE